MADHACERERELLAALAAGRWANSPDPELRAHVAACASCSDLAAVAAALLDDRRAAMRDAAVPGSGLVWWRMQMRSRREKARAAARAVAIAHAVAIAGAVAIGLTLLGATPLAGSIGPVPAVADALRGGTLGAASLRILVSWGGPILLALVAWLALAPVAVWLAVTDE